MVPDKVKVTSALQQMDTAGGADEAARDLLALRHHHECSARRTWMVDPMYLWHLAGSQLPCGGESGAVSAERASSVYQAVTREDQVATPASELAVRRLLRLGTRFRRLPIGDRLDESVEGRVTLLLSNQLVRAPPLEIIEALDVRCALGRHFRFPLS
jgi:hypothetical protein